VCTDSEDEDEEEDAVVVTTTHKAMSDDEEEIDNSGTPKFLFHPSISMDVEAEANSRLISTVTPRL
jgi:hypothetical protein